jgi:iron complex transport system substrate-binding protein
VRVASLLPSATEIVCALDCEPHLVGVSHECDFPETARRLPVLTSARIDTSGSSKAIDVAVRGVIRDALSNYSVDECRSEARRGDGDSCREGVDALRSHPRQTFA